MCKSSQRESRSLELIIQVSVIFLRLAQILIIFGGSSLTDTTTKIK